MKRGIVLTLTLALANPAYALPGDARLVQGTLEWPATVGGEPFIVVRADDGRWYYADVASAQRHLSGPLTAGTRIAVVGVEGAKPHEINVVAFGTGDAAALALALTPRGSGAAAAPIQRAVVREPVSPAPPVPKPPTPAPQALVPPTVAAPTPAPVATHPVPAPSPVTEKAPPTAVAPSVPAPVTEQPAPKATITPPPALKPIKAPAEPEPIATKTAWPADNRWSLLEGTIKVVDGKALVLKLADGQLVLVDVSAINPTALVKPGSTIAVYGQRGEHRFEAVGLVEPDRAPPGPKAAAPPTRKAVAPQLR